MKKALVGVLLFFFIIASLIVSQLWRNGKFIFEYRTNQVQSLFGSDPVFFKTVFEDIFPVTVACQPQNSTECVKKSRASFDQTLALSSNKKGEELSSDKVWPQAPIYFIRYQDGKIEKLFFSGDVKIEVVDTRGERLVVEMLQGKRKKLYGLQANQDGLRMQYLKDLYSEGEVVVPYLQDNAIVGAVVYLHGD